MNLDAVLAMNFRPIFGAQNIYELPINVDGLKTKHQVASRFRGKHLFGEQVTYNLLAGRLNSGAEIRSTLLTAEYGLEAYAASYAGRHLLLFAIDPDGRLQIYTEVPSFTAEPGWRVISLVEPELEAESETEATVG